MKNAQYDRDGEFRYRRTKYDYQGKSGNLCIAPI